MMVCSAAALYHDNMQWFCLLSFKKTVFSSRPEGCFDSRHRRRGEEFQVFSFQMQGGDGVVE
jgi:hypothetical protein